MCPRYKSVNMTLLSNQVRNEEPLSFWPYKKVKRWTSFQKKNTVIINKWNKKWFGKVRGPCREWVSNDHFGIQCFTHTNSLHLGRLASILMTGQEVSTIHDRFTRGQSPPSFLESSITANQLALALPVSCFLENSSISGLQQSMWSFICLSIDFVPQSDDVDCSWWLYCFLGSAGFKPDPTTGKKRATTLWRVRAEQQIPLAVQDTGIQQHHNITQLIWEGVCHISLLVIFHKELDGFKGFL